MKELKDTGKITAHVSGSHQVGPDTWNDWHASMDATNKTGKEIFEWCALQNSRAESLTLIKETGIVTDEEKGGLIQHGRS